MSLNRPNKTAGGNVDVNPHSILALLSRLRWPIAVAIIGIALESLSWFSLRELLRDNRISFYGPGEVTLTVTKPGSYILGHETETFIDGEYRRFADTLPVGTSIRAARVRDNVSVPLRSTVPQSSYSNGIRRVSIGEIRTDQPGDYLISVSGLNEKRRFFVEENTFLRDFLKVFGFGIPGTLLIVVALIWGGAVITRTGNTHDRES